MEQLIRAARVLTSSGWLEHGAVGVSHGRIAWVGRALDAPACTETVDLGEDILAPGFIDLQVNGGGGVLLNDTPTAEAMHRIAVAHRRFGTTSLLPTLISDTPEAMRQALAAAREAIAQNMPGILGLHLEGPYLAPERRGVHREAYFRIPDASDLEQLTTHGLPHLLLTVAPERIDAATLAPLQAAGICLSAGHTAATFEQATAAFDHGVRGVTHLFNAMPPWAGRGPGLIGAALLDERIYCGLIVDGHHLHAATLRLAVRMKPERCFLVSDAMPPVGSDLDEFHLDGRRILVRNGRLETEDGVLAGAFLDMGTAVRVCLEQSGLPLEEVLRMASTYPADFIGAGDRGRIEVGAMADLVQLSSALAAVRTWVSGQRFDT